MVRGAALGLEWCDRTLTVVELGVRGGGMDGLRWGSETFAPGEPATGDRIRGLLQRHGLTGRGRTARLAVSGRAVSIKPIALPPLGDAEQLAILRQDGDRFFLLPRGPRCYGFLGSNGTEHRWTVAAPAPELEELLLAVEAAGLFVESVTPAVSLYPKALELLTPGGGKAAGIRAVARVTEAGVERAQYRDGRVVGFDIADAPGEFGEDPDCVVLLDGDRGPAGEAAARPATLVGAVAAALPLGPDDAVADLMPPVVRQRRERASRRLTAALAAGCAVLLMLFLLLLGRGRVTGRHRLEEAIGAARARAEPILAMQQELHQLSRRVAAYQSAVDGRVDYSRLLDDLSAALPGTAWLASLEVRPGGATLGGYARSASQVLAAIARVPGLGPVRFERPTTRVRLANQELESFTLSVGFSNAPQ